MPPCPRRSIASLAIVAAAAACTDASGPPAGEPIEIVSDAARPDTIGTYLDEPLVVVVHDENGRPLQGATVVFGAPCESCDIYLVGDDASETGTAERTTDAAGQASVMVRLGNRAGPVKLRISAPTGFVDAPFTVLPGNAVDMWFRPNLGAVYFGEPTPVHAETIDRASNGREDPVVYSTDGDVGYTITPDGVLTGLEYGITQLDAQSGDLSTQLIFSIVPRGSFVAGGPVLQMRQMNGEEWAFDFSGEGHAPDWRPDGERLVYHAPTAAGDRFFLIDPEHSSTPVELGPGAGFTLQHARNPRYTRDGGWIWFEAATDGARAGEIWRMRSDGSDPQRIGAEATATEGDFHPDPSPDGTEVVFSSNRNGATPGELVVRTIATGEERRLGVTGNRPSWSPDGEWIAYAAPTGNGTSERFVYLVRPDGSEAHRLSHSGWAMRDGTIDWSPDGAWLLVADGDPSLLEVATGRNVPLLPGPRFLINSAAWRP